MRSSSEHSKWLVEQVKPHEPLLRGYLRRRFPSLPDHDDVVQEAYIRLLRAEVSKPMSNIKAFLLKIARNVALDMLRRKQVTRHETVYDYTKMAVLNEPPSIIEILDRKQRHAVLIDAITTLPERCREVIMLRHLDGLSYKEIAERLGISPNTVKLHIAKGMRDCTTYFRRHGMLEETPAHSASRLNLSNENDNDSR